MTAPGSGARRTALAAGLCAALAGAEARAATFELTDGAVLDGELTRLGERYAAIASGDGVVVLRRDSIASVRVVGDDGETRVGALSAWRDGAYVLDGAGGAVEAIDAVGAAIEAPAAPAAASDPDEIDVRAAPEDAPEPEARQDAFQVQAQPPALAAPTPSIGDLAALDRSPDTEAFVEDARPATNDAPTRAPAPPTRPVQAERPPVDPRLAAAPSAPSPPPAPSSASDDDPEMRGLLTNLIFGDGGGSPATAPAPSVPAAPSAPSGGARAATPVVAAAPTPAPPPREDAIAIALSGAAATPAELYQRAVLGVGASDFAAPEDLRACLPLAEMVEAPGATDAGRADPGALVVGVSGEMSMRLVRRLSLMFLDATPAGPAALAATLAGAEPLRPTATRLALPRAIDTAQHQSAEEARLALANGALDIAIYSHDGAPPETARLIGFDALALVVHESNPVTALSPREIGGLLAGRINDWSMIDPSFIGAPMLYPPPSGSESLRRLLDFSSERRARPARGRYLAAPAARLEALAADPSALAIAPMSVLGADAPSALRPVRIGRAGAGAPPTADAARAGEYPILAPIYVEARPGAHPAARLLVDFMLSPPGQRALFEGGFVSVAACDPSSCPLAAPGFEEARRRLVELSQWRRLAAAPATGVGGSATRLVFPTAGASAPAPLVAELEALARAVAADPAAPVTVRAPGAGAGADASAVRAEAVALMLRCAGGWDVRLMQDPASETASPMVEVQR